MSILETPLEPTFHLMQNATCAATCTYRWRSKRQRKAFLHRSMSLASLTKAFPAVHAVLAQLASDWIESQHEMLYCLCQDRETLLALLPMHATKELRVTEIVPGLSDPHNAGRSVTLLCFNGGHRVIYKPRSADGEHVWFGMLRWMNDGGFSARFAIPKILARRGYFWMVFLQRRSCASDQMMKKFYFRWGAQAAVAQVLGAQDLHRQNWIAVGSQPILADAELVSHPNFSWRLSPTLSKWGNLHPLLRTGLLPIYESDRVGTYSDLAPFDRSAALSKDLSFLPRCAGRIRLPCNYPDDLVSGYKAAAVFFNTQERTRTVISQMLRLTRKRTYRVLLRPTIEYYKLLLDSYSPDNMSNVDNRLQYLKTRCSAKTSKQGTSEILALSRGCIPFFTAKWSVSEVRKRAMSSHEINRSARLFRRRLLRR